MGRPISKKYFGDHADAVKLNHVDGPAVIIAQKGVGRYIVDVDGTLHIVRLVNREPTADNEASLIAKPFGGDEEFVRSLAANDVKTFDGKTYKWSLAAATKAGQAQLLPPDEPEDTPPDLEE